MPATSSAGSAFSRSMSRASARSHRQELRPIGCAPGAPRRAAARAARRARCRRAAAAARRWRAPARSRRAAIRRGCATAPGTAPRARAAGSATRRAAPRAARSWPARRAAASCDWRATERASRALGLDVAQPARELLLRGADAAARVEPEQRGERRAARRQRDQQQRGARANAAVLLAFPVSAMEAKVCHQRARAFPRPRPGEHDCRAPSAPRCARRCAGAARTAASLRSSSGRRAPRTDWPGPALEDTVTACDWPLAQAARSGAGGCGHAAGGSSRRTRRARRARRASRPAARARRRRGRWRCACPATCCSAGSASSASLSAPSLGAITPRDAAALELAPRAAAQRRRRAARAARLRDLRASPCAHRRGADEDGEIEFVQAARAQPAASTSARSRSPERGCARPPASSIRRARRCGLRGGPRDDDAPSATGFRDSRGQGSRRPLAAQVLRDLLAQRFGVRRSSPSARAITRVPSGDADQRAQPHACPPVHLGEGAERHACNCRRARGSPRARRARRPWSPRRRAARAAPRPPCASAQAFDAERALSRRRQALARRRAARGCAPARPSRFSPAAASTIASYSPRSSLARRVSTLPRSRRDFEARMALDDLRLRAAGSRCRRGARRQVREDAVSVRHESVARIFALGDRGEHEARRQLHRHVLHRMHGEIGAAVGQRVLELLDEQALAAGLVERAGRAARRRAWSSAAARRAARVQRSAAAAATCSRLPQREPAAARGDDRAFFMRLPGPSSRTAGHCRRLTGSRSSSAFEHHQPVRLVVVAGRALEAADRGARHQAVAVDAHEARRRIPARARPATPRSGARARACAP